MSDVAIAYRGSGASIVVASTALPWLGGRMLPWFAKHVLGIDDYKRTPKTPHSDAISMTKPTLK